jgi:hypothetical protein
LGLAEAVLTTESNRLLLLAFVTPLLAVESTERQSNLIGSIDLAFHLTESSSVYLQVLVDDITTVNPPVRRKIGLLIGGHWKDRPLDERWDVRLEYAFTDPGVYDHRNPSMLWEFQERPLGHRIGGDAQDVFLRVRYSPTPHDDLTLVGNLLRKGRRQSSPMNDRFWSLGYHHDFTPRAFAGLRWVRRRVRNLGLVSGLHRGETRLWLEAGYGF